jgi:hypothetical protein
LREKRANFGGKKATGENLHCNDWAQPTA